MNKLKNTVRMKKTLRNEYIIPLDVEIATILGINQSIILQQIHHWLCINEKANRNYIHDTYWTYNSIPEWQKQLPFISETTIKKTLASLEAMKVIISGQHSVNKFDKTKWYTIDYEKLDCILNDSATDRSDQNDPIGNIGENYDLTNGQSLKPAIYRLDKNDPIERGNLTRCYTKTNYTKNKKRDARAREELFLDNWEPKDKDLLKSKYSLTDDDITTAIIEFKLDSNAKGRLWHDIDAAFELWCSRYKACKKRYQKALKPLETICNTTGCDTFSDYVCKVLGSVLDTQICENIKVAYLKAHKLLCIDSKNELIKNKLHDYQDKIMNLLSSAKDKQSSYYNEYYAMELHIMQSVSIDDVIERL